VCDSCLGRCAMWYPGCRLIRTVQGTCCLHLRGCSPKRWYTTRRVHDTTIQVSIRTQLSSFTEPSSADSHHYTISMFSFATEFMVYCKTHLPFQCISYTTSKTEIVDKLGWRVRFPHGAMRVFLLLCYLAQVQAL
jgi:hypothetical protein